MTETTESHWNVLPHGDLQELEDGILTVVGQIRMPLGHLPRRMTVVRLRDRRLVIWSAIALDEASMSQLEAYGTPAIMIVPNDHHRYDARAWKQRYPQLQVVAPAGASEKVAKKVAVDTIAPDFGDPNVRMDTIDGTRAREAALIVRTAKGTTLILNDIVGNIHNASGMSGWMLRVTGFAGETPQVPKVVKFAMIEDAEALRSQLLKFAEIDSLIRIIVSHGDPIETNPRYQLHMLADTLAKVPRAA
jgi:hypothetical protein